MAFLYADGGDDWLGEDAPVHATGPTETALVAEANARHLFGGETVVLRFGLFIGPDSHLTRSDIQAARAGISPSLGRRSAYRATVWLDDAAAAVTSVIAAPPGVYNVADTDPPTRAEIDAALAAAVGRGALRPALDEVPRAVEADRALAARLKRASARGDRLGADGAGWDGRLVAHPRATDRGMTVEQRFAEMRPRLLRLAYSELGDLSEAEDVVQEAWLRLERTGADSVCDLDGWLTIVVARLALDALRSARATRRRTSARGCLSRCCRRRRRTRPTASRSTSR